MHSEYLISQADGRPMYLQLIEQIKRRIVVGDWKAGQEIPSIRALSASINVSVITVKRAYYELEREGVIITRQGKASFVSDNVDLSKALSQRELDEHISALADLAVALDLSPEELDERIHKALNKAKKEKP